MITGESAERLFGPRPPGGRPTGDHPDPGGALDEEPGILRKARRGRHIEHYETVRRRKDGSLIDLSLTVSPMKGAEADRRRLEDRPRRTEGK